MDIRLQSFGSRKLAALRRMYPEHLGVFRYDRSETVVYGGTLLDRAAMRGVRSEVQEILEGIDWDRVF